MARRRAQQQPEANPQAVRETAEQAKGPPRWPVPLPLHLALSNLVLGSCCAALPLSRNGSIDWKPACRDAAAELEPLLRAAPAEPLAQAVLEAALRRLARVQDGIERYAAAPPPRPDPPGPLFWQCGTTRIHDVGPQPARTGAPAILLVPSLVNRAHILALGPGPLGLAGWLAGQGFRPLLLDWDRPGRQERGFAIADYVERRLRPALQAVRAAGGDTPPLVLGYCMGGLLALAALLREGPGAARALALVAVPWDFGLDPLFAATGRMLCAQEAPLRAWIRSRGELPPEFLQALFVLRDPSLPLRKFPAFAALPEGSAEAEAFRALEGWANDGVPLAGPVAEECLFDWFGRNSPALGAWQVCGQDMVPERLDLPVFAAIASRDRLVPAASATALARRIPGATTLTVAGGHVGMVAGPGAAAGLWRPLSDWLLARCTAA